MDLWKRLKALVIRPILDVDIMCKEISENTGIPQEVVETIIDHETVYMLKAGFAYQK